MMEFWIFWVKGWCPSICVLYAHILHFCDQYSSKPRFYSMLYDNKKNPLYLWGLKRSRYSDTTAWGDHGQTIPEYFLLKENNAKSSNHSMYNTRKPAFSPAYLLVLVEWVDDQLHHAVDFSLEGMFFGLFSEFLDLRRVQSIQLDRLLLSKESQMQRTDTGDTGAWQITAVQQQSVPLSWTSVAGESKTQDFPISVWDVPQTFPLIRL